MKNNKEQETSCSSPIEPVVMCDARYAGNNELKHLRLTDSFKFIRCCFEDMTIDDFEMPCDTFDSCYFENVIFSSGKHLTGLGGNNYQHPKPTLDT